jgi:gliding motility-associated-like protein
LPAGDTTFYYTVEDNTTHCVGAVQTYSITVDSIPVITGNSTVTVGNSITLTGTPSGGTWSSSDNNYATVTNGSVTGIASGTVTITYTTPAGCENTKEIEISTVGPMGNDSTVYFCPEDVAGFTLHGYGSNITSWAWYKQGDTAPTGGTTVEGDKDKTIAAPLTAADSATVWIFRGFNGVQFADQKFKLLKNADYTFSVQDTTVCKDATITLTALTATGASGIQYDWANGGYAATSTYTLNTTTAGLNQPLSIKGKATGYCETTVNITNDIVELVASQSGTWSSSVYAGDNITYAVSTTGSTLPAGGSVEFVWEKSSNPATTYTALAETSATLTEVPAADACYRVTAKMYNAAHTQLCSDWTTTQCVTLTTIVKGKDSTVYFCPDDNLTLSGSAENVDAYAWYKEGTPEPTGGTPLATQPGDINDTHTLNNVQAANDGDIWYFKVFSGSNTAKQTFTITKNPDYAFTTDSTSITACVGSTVVVTPTNTDGIAGASYAWTATNEAAAQTGNTFTLNTADGASGNTLIGTIIVEGKATDRCVSQRTIPYTLTEIPTATIAYANTPFCSDAVPQTVTLNGYTGGTYSAPADLTINATDGTITPSSSTAGDYTVTYTIPAAGGCVAVAVTTGVTVTQLPSVNISYATPFCSDGGIQSVSFTGDIAACTGGTFSSATSLDIDPTGGAINPSNSTPGNYTVTYTIPAANGCTPAPVTTNIVITPKPTATISYATPFCKTETAAQPVTLTGTGAYAGGTYTATPAGLSIAANGYISPGASTPGNYTVTYTIAAADGCSQVTTTANASIIATPTVNAFAPNSQSICSGEIFQSVTPIGSAGAIFEWTAAAFGVSNATLSGNGTINGEVLNGAGSVTYTITPKTSGTPQCIGTPTAYTVNVRQALDFDISAKTPVCPGEATELKAAIVGISPGEKYTKIWWRKGETQIDREFVAGDTLGLDYLNAKDYPKEKTVYYFETKYADGTCPRKDSVSVTIAELPQILSIEQEKYISGKDTTYTKTYEFYVRGEQPISFVYDGKNVSADNYFEFARIGSHTVLVRDGNGCETDSTFVVEGVPLVFPKYFSPNGDENNPTWYIKNIEFYPEIELLIYDRFSKQLDKVTHSQDWRGWNGTYLNKPLPSDDYWYVLQIKETGKKYVGHFTLLR